MYFKGIRGLLSLMVTFTSINSSYSQCSSCDNTITSSQGGFTVTAGTTTCIIPTPGTNVTISGTVTVRHSHGILEVCSAAGDTVQIDGNFLVNGGSGTNNVFVNNYGNLIYNGAGQTLDSKYNFNNYGYFGINNTFNIDAKYFNNTGTMEVFNSTFLAFTGDTVYNSGTMLLDTSASIGNGVSFINSGTLDVQDRGGLQLNGALTNSGTVNIGLDMNVNSGSTLINELGATIHAGQDITMAGTVNTNNGTIIADSTLELNGATIDVTGGNFTSYNLRINAGGITAGAGSNCSSFLVYNRSEVIKSDITWSGLVNIQDLNGGAVGDSLDVNNCTGTGCNFKADTSGGTCNPISLPVELLTFDGKRDGARNKLYWITANETNNDYFILTKSTDGSDFENIGEINGAGTHNGVLEYTFYDYDPKIGNNYYRLKQVDYDGKSTNSNIIVIGLDDFYIDVLYPNPADDYIRIVLYSGQDYSVGINIIDALGKVYFSSFQEATAGTNTMTIPVSNLATGTYFLSVQTLEGNKETTKEFLISR